MIREWSRQITEAERLDILVHELSHYLGAAHSAEPHSVMQPHVRHLQSRLRGHRIRFDALNTLVMCLMCEEIRKGPTPNFTQLSSATKDQLRPIYKAIHASLPDDPAASQMSALLKPLPGLAGVAPEQQRAVFSGARRIVQAVSEAVRHRDSLTRQDGDRLTEHYIRAAAAAAAKLPRPESGKAFLLGLGVALSDASTLPGPPILAALWRQIDPPQSRATRLASFSVPTMRARRDAVEHFAMSAALAALLGAPTAEKAGTLKELSDAQGGSGFSFVDISADMAGIAFAQAVLDGRLPLSRIETAFTVKDFVPRNRRPSGRHHMDRVCRRLRQPARRSLEPAATGHSHKDSRSAGLQARSSPFAWISPIIPHPF